MTDADLLKLPLTDRQRFALGCVATGRFNVVTRRIGKQTVGVARAHCGTEIGQRFRSLYRRGLIAGKFGDKPSLTVSGALELYFDPSAIVSAA